MRAAGARGGGWWRGPALSQRVEKSGNVTLCEANSQHRRQVNSVGGGLQIMAAVHLDSPKLSGT